MDATTLQTLLQARVPGARVEPVASLDCPTFVVAREYIVDLLRALRDDPELGYSLLEELTAADYFPREPRFEVVYHLVRLGVKDFPRPGANPPAARLRLKVPVPGDQPRVPTALEVFPNANWLEREVFDLFGVIFEGHPDLRRLLMPDEWEGHPLRKDYPVQVSVPVRTTSAIELTEQEFVDNIQRQRRDTGPVPKP